ncbi:hypothetical protein RHA1_ro08136 (plasmid) [Rhodococcus jostii RHA1]|uniref:Uncharacterized protein n=2 Tax=Rhodococcus TaxID=1827 RepID=A0A2S2C599_9NOCA|nr:hypothetical protein RHA1_ro08136 [Rhodococcus jostii RHA1]AWK75984.1 hypothetical protein CBI38_30745 [Rhodococcus oxybenzonivorans]
MVGYIPNRPAGKLVELDRFHDIAELFFDIVEGEEQAWISEPWTTSLASDAHYLLAVDKGGPPSSTRGHVRPRRPAARLSCGRLRGQSPESSGADRFGIGPTPGRGRGDPRRPAAPNARSGRRRVSHGDAP